MTTYTLTVVRGEQPRSIGHDIGEPDSPIQYMDLPADVHAWLDNQGFGVDNPDVWILVTPADEDPRAVNVIGSRQVTPAALPIAILNTAILTSDGSYEIHTIDLQEARVLVSDTEIDSAVGHESTAAILTDLLGVEVALNRQLFAQKPGQKALVFKLNGRPPEGVVLSREQLEEIGFTFKVLTRLR